MDRRPVRSDRKARATVMDMPSIPSTRMRCIARWEHDANRPSQGLSLVQRGKRNLTADASPSKATTRFQDSSYGNSDRRCMFLNGHPARHHDRISQANRHQSHPHIFGAASMPTPRKCGKDSRRISIRSHHEREARSQHGQISEKNVAVSANPGIIPASSGPRMKRSAVTIRRTRAQCPNARNSTHTATPSLHNQGAIP